MSLVPKWYRMSQTQALPSMSTHEARKPSQGHKYLQYKVDTATPTRMGMGDVKKETKALESPGSSKWLELRLWDR